MSNSKATTITTSLSLVLLLFVLSAPPVLVVVAADQDEGCNLPLDPSNGKTDPCIAICLGHDSHNLKTFVCDISAEWLHHVGGVHAWYPATPPKGTGIHEYVAYADATPPCPEKGYCKGCHPDELYKTGKDQHPVCSVKIDPETCEIVSCEKGIPPHRNKMVVALGLLLAGGVIVYKVRQATKLPQDQE